MSDEVIRGKRKRARPSRNEPLKNPARYSKTALVVYKRRRFHMELMTRIELVNLILTKDALYRLSYISTSNE